jgi:hypothetical protein
VADKSNDSPLLRGPGQTTRWYVRARGPWVLAALVVVGIVWYLSNPLKPHHPAPPTTTTIAAPTTTTPPTTSTLPPTTTTTVHHVVHPTTTTTVHHITPPTTTTTRYIPPTTTTTVRHVPSKYEVSFTCSGGQSVIVTGTGATAKNTLVVVGPNGFVRRASGKSATIQFTAVLGAYQATDTDSTGANVTWYASPSCTP